MNHIPIKIAIPTLNKVPINIYSVNSLLLLSFKSLNLKTDFGAIKKPITSQRPKINKETLNNSDVHASFRQGFMVYFYMFRHNL